MKVSNINIIFCSELGVLEKQSVLLINSIKKWLHSSQFSVHAYSPRQENLPKAETLKWFAVHGVAHHNRNLNVDFIDYPIANKVLACADFERQNPNNSSMIFVDTDTIFTNQMGTSLMTNKPAIYLRPVDNKGPGSESVNDENDKFWQEIFSLFNLPTPKPSVSTAVRTVMIRPYYNAGFIWVNKLPGFFQQWYADFMTIVASELRPFGYTSRDGDDFRCLDQVALAVTATRYQKYIKILPETYNYPLPFKPYMKDRQGHPKLNDLVHLHYHKWFQHPGFLDHITNDDEKQTEQYKWLKEQLPLSPEIDGPFKC